MSRLALLAAFAASIAVVAPTAARAEVARIPAYIAEAIASPLRPPRDTARDASQKPAEMLAFAGVKPGDRVADFWPTPPYSTALLSGVVGTKGRVYGIVPPKLFRDIPAAEPQVRAALAPYSNVTLLVQDFDQFEVPEPLDLIWLGKIYHDFPNIAEMGAIDIAKVNAAIFKALKSGGVYIVIDHAAPPGSGYRDTTADAAKRLHRIDPAIVKADANAAGFEFTGESKLLANPDDDRSRSAFDPALRNRTDRFVLKFRKPG